MAEAHRSYRVLGHAGCDMRSRFRERSAGWKGANNPRESKSRLLVDFMVRQFIQ
jgi:hypothetical protein